MKKLFFITMLLATFYCCKKETSISQSTSSPSPTSSTPINTTSLKIGNYWVYEASIMDTLGNTTVFGIDSLYIYDTVTLGGNKYYKSSPGLFSSDNIYVRDSINSFLVNEKGFVLCAYNNFTDTFYKYSKLVDIDTGFYKMFQVPGIYSVPSGNFNNCIDARTTLFHNSTYMCQKLRYCNRIFADSVGVIYERIYLSTNCNYIIKRLLRYKIK